MAAPKTTPNGRPSRLAGMLVPPDFLPERRVESTTWAEAIFEPVALIGCVVCFVLGMIHFGLALAPDWPTRFLGPLAVVVGIEAFLYSRRLTRGTVMLKEWLVLLAPVVVVLRLLPYLDDPSRSLVADVGSWIHDPASFFTLAFVADCLILLGVWLAVFSGTQLLNQLRVQEGEIPPEGYSLTHQLYEDNWRAVDHSQPLRQLGQLFVTGGVILVIVSALAALGSDQFLSLDAISEIVGFRRPSVQLVQANVMLYFILGLMLLGEAQLVRQRTLWRLDRLSIPAEVPGAWVGGVVGLILLAAIVALILPTSYAMTLGDMVSAVIGFLAQITLYFMAGIFYLFYLVASLFHLSGAAAATPPPAAPPHLPGGQSPHGGASPLDALKSLVFWLVALGIIGYSLSVLWRRRGPGFGNLPLGRILRVPFVVLLAIWNLVRRIGLGVGQAVAATVPRLFRQAPAAAQRQLRFISLSRLGPRELVEYFYLSVCERAAQLGVPRPPGMTPAEYRQLLKTRLPLVDPELDSVTDAFLEARYGPRSTSREQAGAVRRTWDSLKRKLRAARVERANGRK